jgi:hypothetical protein
MGNTEKRSQTLILLCSGLTKGYCRPSSRRFRFRQQHPPARKGESSLAVCVLFCCTRKQEKVQSMRAESSSHGRVPTLGSPAERFNRAQSKGPKLPPILGHGLNPSVCRHACVAWDRVGTWCHWRVTRCGVWPLPAPSVHTACKSHCTRTSHPTVTPRKAHAQCAGARARWATETQPNSHLETGQKGIAIRAVTPIHS